MQFRLISAFVIFIGSYLPLAIILAVQDIPKEWWGLSFCTMGQALNSSCMFNPFNHPSPALLFLSITLISTLIAQRMFAKISYPLNVEVLSAKSIPNDLINYVFPYVVSFMGIGFGEPEKLLGFFIFLLWMFAITYKSGQIILNPLLLMFGWHFYEATILINGVSREVRVLKKGLLIPGMQWAQTIQDFYIARD
jgi:hypothetical protein